MGKEKLFSPEDFDKPVDKNWWQKYRGLILGLAGALIVLAVILCCILFKDMDKKEALTQQELTDNTQVETLLEDKSSSNSETQEIQENEKSEKELDNSNIEVVAETPTPTANQKEEEPQKSVVNERVSNNVETEALNVIRGNYGNGEVRKSNLGEKYQSIQNRVNELKRQGTF